MSKYFYVDEATVDEIEGSSHEVLIKYNNPVLIKDTSNGIEYIYKGKVRSIDYSMLADLVVAATVMLKEGNNLIAGTLIKGFTVAKYRKS
jgi:hypothetical protein